MAASDRDDPPPADEPHRAVDDLRKLGNRLEGELRTAARIREAAHRTLQDIGFTSRPAHNWEAPDRPLILVADDEPDTPYAPFLQNEGYRVALVADGASAIEATQRLRPSVIVMDLRMPGIDGWEATRRIKQDATLREIPVIVVTGTADGDARERAEGAGCDAYCLKPCPPDVLLAEILRVLLAKKRTPQRPGGSLRGARVLVVEDHTDSRDMLCEALRIEGAEVRAAVTKAQALELLRAQRVDLIVSDVRLPDGSAHDLVRVVRTWPADQGGETPALAVTAFASVADHFAALSAGFDGYMPKPVDPHVLQKTAAELAREHEPKGGEE